MAYDPQIAVDAAKAWAQEHAPSALDPVKFGHDVALVYLAAEMALVHQGDEKATAAALGALSVPPEVWQSLALLSGLARPSQGSSAVASAPRGSEG